jgi:hypothetical protein
MLMSSSRGLVFTTTTFKAKTVLLVSNRQKKSGNQPKFDNLGEKKAILLKFWYISKKVFTIKCVL